MPMIAEMSALDGHVVGTVKDEPAEAAEWAGAEGDAEWVDAPGAVSPVDTGPDSGPIEHPVSIVVASAAVARSTGINGRRNMRTTFA